MTERLEKLKKIGIFTAEDVQSIGIHATTLGRRAKAGLIQRVDRGVGDH